MIFGLGCVGAIRPCWVAGGAGVVLGFAFACGLGWVCGANWYWRLIRALIISRFCLRSMF